MEYILKQNLSFSRRHIGPSEQEIEQMLKYLSLDSVEDLIKKTIPQSIRYPHALKLAEAQDEYQTLSELREKAQLNKILKSYIGTGYYGTITPSVIQRNILENPGWYTQYTPYQAEIAQGRLEALLNFQTMVMELTGFDIANASMLDEATSAAEAMTLAMRVSKSDANSIFVSQNCHPQTIAVVKTRAEALGVNVIVGSHDDFQFDPAVFAVLVQYPDTFGNTFDFSTFTKRAHENKALVIVAADLLALTTLVPPGEWGADIAIGNTQRFGVPFGFGGPHAAYMATKSEYKRQMPGRFVGVSKDSRGKQALRLALQTREQHIRRDKATSNICTAQVLLAVMASMYAVYHGPKGLRDMALRVNWLTSVMRSGLEKLKFKITNATHFDTLTVESGHQHASHIVEHAEENGYNLRLIDDKHIGLSFDETTQLSDVENLLKSFNLGSSLDFSVEELAQTSSVQIPKELQRKSEYLTHPVFNSYHSETEMQRYMQRLQAKDLSLTTSMIPLGSCTMKLNSAVQMIPVTWHLWSQLHPFAPKEQVQGYLKLIRELETMLSEITGFPAISMQPNAGSQGEYAGLLTIRAYHKSRGEEHRNICLIPQSAHGTNPASAVMAGMKVVVVACDDNGNIDLEDLKLKAEKHSNELSALMVTYPSTHGVFEEEIIKICSLIHQHGGQVYMDGANMNAQVGLCRPADYGADVLHLNLHKTFCIPHGGGGPGMGPIGVQKHLAPFLPSHPVIKNEMLYNGKSDPLNDEGVASSALGTVSAATWGSPNILVIPWAYIRAMGAQGLKEATEVAILNANYMAKKLEPYYPVLYKGKNGFVAHECIIDLRPIKDETGVGVEDVAKRLMDYGFHAPTISFPVVGTMMIEPTESESKAELDRFCDAMISIKKEIDEIKNKKLNLADSPLTNAPHTIDMVVNSEWNKKYTREEAAFPAPWLKQHKFWPSVGRVDNVYGDKNLMCACPPMEAYEE